MTSTIPRDFIEQLLTKIDIVDLINTHLPLRKKSNNNYFACCPFHQEKTASFSVSQTKQFYHCFGCGAHGNAIDFIMQLDHLTFPDAIEFLAHQAGMDIPRESAQGNKQKALHSLYDWMNIISQHYYEQLCHSKRAIDYLKQRGISGKIAKQFCLGYAPHDYQHLINEFGKTADHHQKLIDTGLIIIKDKGNQYDRFRDRILFPIHDYRGRVIGFGGRVIDQGEPKYLNSPETDLFQKGRELYGLYQVLKHNRQVKEIIVVEGYMDVLALFQHGITNCVASLGTATTEYHLKRLFRYTPKIIFCFDADEAGKIAAWRALQVAFPLLTDEIQIYFLFLPDGEDPDSFIQKQGKKSFELLAEQAVPLSTFFFHTLSKKRNVHTIEDRAGFAAEALDFIKLMPESQLKQIFVDELSKRTRIEHSNLIKNTSHKKIDQIEHQSSSQTNLAPPVEMALTLLIQQPNLANEIKQDLPNSQLPGLGFLKKLLNIIKEATAPTTAFLFEYFRGKKEESYITHLASVKHLIPDDRLCLALLESIERINFLSLSHEINLLLIKASSHTLTESEKSQLSNYIAQKNAYASKNTS